MYQDGNVRMHYIKCKPIEQNGRQRVKIVAHYTDMACIQFNSDSTHNAISQNIKNNYSYEKECKQHRIYLCTC